MPRARKYPVELLDRATRLVFESAVWKTTSQLELAIVEYVAWFNSERLHTSLGGVPPAEYERQHARR